MTLGSSMRNFIRKLFLVSSKMASELKARQIILHEYIKNPALSARKIGKNVKLHHSTVSRVLNRYKEGLTVARKPGSGGEHGQSDENSARKVLRAFSQDPKVSTRSVAKSVRKSRSFVQKVKQRASLRSFKAQTAPDRDAKQNFTAKSRSRKLYESKITKYECIVMDDETYCYQNFKYIAGQDFYTAASRQDAPESCKIKTKSKFPKKIPRLPSHLLLWP